MANIQGLVSNTGVQLEARAFGAFGAAVAQQDNGLLNSIFASIAPSAGKPASVNISPQLAADLKRSHPTVWDPTPYASAFASGAGGFDPKTKFLFKVSFRLNPGVSAEIANLFGIANTGQFAAVVTFTVKSIDLPKYKFEYEEVNYYNFRTSILKKVTHDELGFTLYDTTGNQALHFMNAYLQVLMPSTRQSYTTDFSLWDHGFAFTKSPQNGIDSGSRAELGVDGSEINIFDQMIIDQYYLSRDPGSNLKGSNIIQAIKANSFVFTNPKLTHFELGDQDHEKGAEAQMINCGFTYDTMYLQTDQSGVEVNSRGPVLNDDILSSVLPNPITSNNATHLIGGKGGGFINPFIKIFSAQLGRTITSTVDNALAKKTGLGNSPGGGLLISPIGGALGVTAQKTIGSLGTTAPGISPPSIPVLSDNSQANAQASQLPASTSI